MSRKMKDSGIEWIGEIPEGWEVKKIKYLPDNNCKDAFIDGDWIDSTYIEDKGIRYLTTGNIGDGVFKEQGAGYISFATFRQLNCKYAYPSDLIISRLNAPHGRSCLLNSEHDKYVLAVDNVILRPIANKKFICFVTRCTGYQKSVEDKAGGTTMKRISRINLGNIFIPLAQNKGQQKIASFLDEKCSRIDSLAADIRKQIEILEQYRKSVITEAVTKGLDSNARMRDSGIEWGGEIPEEWEVDEINSLYCIRNTKVDDERYPPLSVTKQGVFPQLENVAKSDNHEDRKLVKQGDFVINSRSARQGACDISKYDGSVSIINIVMQPKKRLCSQYYNWLFHTTQFAEEFYKCGYGIVDDLWTTTWRDMKKISVPLPSVNNTEKDFSFVFFDEIKTVMMNMTGTENFQR